MNTTGSFIGGAQVLGLSLPDFESVSTLLGLINDLDLVPVQAPAQYVPAA